MTTRKVLVDGLEVETTEAGAAAIKKLQDSISTKDGEITTLKADHAKALTDKDTEIGELKVKLADAEKAIPDAAAMTKMVADRVTLETTAKRIAPNVDPANLSDADLRKAAVAAVHGEDMVKDADDAEIIGMFRLAANAKADPTREAFSQPRAANDADPWAFLDKKEAV